MGNKQSDLADGQHDPRRYPASHIGMPPASFPPPMRKMPRGARSEIMTSHRKMVPPDPFIPYGTCLNGKTLKKMSKKEKKLYEAGAYAAPPIPRLAPLPPQMMNGAPRPFSLYQRAPPPMMMPRGFGPPRMLAIMPPPTMRAPSQFPMAMPPQPQFYHPRQPGPVPQPQLLPIEYHKNSTTVNDSDAVVTVEADVAIRPMDDRIQEIENPKQSVDQKPPKLPEPNKLKESYGNQSTTLQTSSTAKKPVKVVEDLTVLNRTPLLVVSPEAETIFKKNAQLLAKAESLQNQKPISCIINDDVKIEEVEIRMKEEIHQKPIFEEVNDIHHHHHHPARRLEFDYMQDVDFGGKLRNVEEVIARRTVLTKDQELKDLDDFDTVFAPKNQISNFGGTIEKNRNDIIQQFRKPVLPSRSDQQAPLIFDPISSWRQIDQQNDQFWRKNLANHTADDYPYDEYSRPVDERIIVHLATKPPLKRLDSKKKTVSLDDLKNDVMARKTWEAVGQDYVDGYGEEHRLEYVDNSSKQNFSDRYYPQAIAEDPSAEGQTAHTSDVRTNGNLSKNDFIANGYEDENDEWERSSNNRCCSPSRRGHDNDLSWISDLEARLFEKAESNTITNGLKNFRAETLMRKSNKINHEDQQRQNFDTDHREIIPPHRPKIIHSLRKMDDTNLNPSSSIFDNFSYPQNGDRFVPLQNGHYRQQNPKNCHKSEEEPIYIPRPDYDLDYSSYIYGHVIKPKMKSEDDILAASRHVTGKQGVRTNGFPYALNGDQYGQRNGQQKTLMRNSHDDISARKIAIQNGFSGDANRRNGTFNEDGRVNGYRNECGRRNGIVDDNYCGNGALSNGGRVNGFSIDIDRKNGISMDDYSRKNGTSHHYGRENGTFDENSVENCIFSNESKGLRNGKFDRQNYDMYDMDNRFVW